MRSISDGQKCLRARKPNEAEGCLREEGDKGKMIEEEEKGREENNNGEMNKDVYRKRQELRAMEKRN